MKRLLAPIVIAAFLFASLLPAASASGNCTFSGSMANCSGITDSQYVSGHYVFVNSQYVYVDGYYTQSTYYSYSCNHYGSTWNCTQIVPSYATWTVPG